MRNLLLSVYYAFFALSVLSFSVLDIAGIAHASGSGPIPDQWVSLLKRMVETNSSSDNPEGLEKMRAILIPELKVLGFQTRTVELEGQHKILIADFAHEKPELLLMGHVDTVFSKTSSFQKFGIQNDRYLGPGVIDMKGGNTLMLHVLSELKKSGLSLKKIRVLINDDEELGSPFSKSTYMNLVKGMTHALVFEPGLPNSAVVSSHSGVQDMQLTVKGKAAHAGMDHEKGVNACVELANKIIKLSRLTDYQRKLKVNVGVMKGGTKANIVCDEASAVIDIRYIKKEDLDFILAEIEKIKNESTVHNSLLNLSPQAELKPISNMVNMPEEASASILKVIQSLSSQLGHMIQGQYVGYGSDGGPLAQAGLSVLVGLGPYGGGMHTDQEFMDFASYQERFKLNTLLIKELLK